MCFEGVYCFLNGHMIRNNNNYEIGQGFGYNVRNKEERGF